MLASLLPGEGAPPLSADDVLSSFVNWAQERGLTLYPAQEEAILELLAGNHLVLSTPTGSGKSLVATAFIFKARAEGKRAFYTCPIKALVNEKFFALCDAFGPDQVGMLTGDASINRDAPIICCTAEILANLALREKKPPVDFVVMDEFHYYGDRERGGAWQIPLLTMTEATFLLMSATLGDMRGIEESLRELTGREVASVRSAQRPVPLEYSYAETPLHETVEHLVNQNKAPIYLVNFTQRAAAEQAQNLMSVNFSTKEEKEEIRRLLEGVAFDTPYGKELQRFLRHGIGLHHAGLLPKYRLTVEKLAQSGLLKVVSGTDTLGVGVNIPLRTVLFTQLCKFGGEKVAVLSARDFHQISGRAGRKGFDDRGYVVAQAPEHVIENIRLEQKAASGKKVVKQKPPTKGYAHWDRATFEKLIERPPEPLESRFQVTHGLLLNLLQSMEHALDNGYRKLVVMILRSHGRPHDRRQHLKTAAAAFRTLRTAGLIEVERGGRGYPASVKVSSSLQWDFSLFHTLSLYLLQVLPKLDPTSPTYALDVMSLVESILENPDAVLYAQLRKAKDEKIAQLKSQGVEYEQRMEELEKVEWPKPLADFIYPTFNDFAARHPWVGQENIRPKSIARDMFERYCSFDDYVREYGLQRSEGVLLRYLAEAYKTLHQNVPEEAQTEEVDDLILHLRTLLREVDSSLLDEWERLRDGGAAGQLGQGIQPAETPEPPTPLSEDPRRLAARARREAHRLLKHLADRRYEEALASLRKGEVEWDVGGLEAAMAPYFAEWATLDVTPRARRPEHTLLRQVEPKVWSVTQRMLSPPPLPNAQGDIEGDPASEAPEESEWAFEALIDLRGEPDEDKPLLALRRIGT